jgi:hypothetical protein
MDYCRRFWPFGRRAKMTFWPVSTRVGKVKNDNPGLIEPIAAQ